MQHTKMTWSIFIQTLSTFLVNKLIKERKKKKKNFWIWKKTHPNFCNFFLFPQELYYVHYLTKIYNAD